MQTHRERSLSKYANHGRSVGFTAVELVVVIAVLALGAGLLLPALAKGGSKKRIKCVNNLKQVGLAFRIWEGDNGDHYPMSVLTNNARGPLYTNSIDVFRYFQVMSNELSNPQIVTCPQDTNRRSATNFTTDFNSSHISYFVGLDAADATLPQVILAGDSTLTNGQPLNTGLMELRAGQPIGWRKGRHEGFGDIAFADGSVQQIASSGLQAFLQKSGMTNRLLMPPEIK